MLLLFLGDSIQCTRFFLPDVQLNWEPVSCSIQSTAMVEFGRSGFLLCADSVSLRSEKDTYHGSNGRAFVAFIADTSLTLSFSDISPEL